ncbi:hypothetical protein BT93_L4256 [Corymbia citriodora subsp. variegata]|uniref:GS catalytic domain-containing protein n=1 Tax=Corymbia citriodora subsp. variegata TaxID=360336 RepID=A0A8T0CG12_CORYI|nr:hypothetical protein BT93_L4256 [Corymbia citriodora subsp. variegata]
MIGTHALLIDDGLPQGSVYPVSWHEQLVPTAKRIARIEAIAADLLERLLDSADLSANWSIAASEAILTRFNTMFRKEIRKLASDPSVRGFKSVVCYRSGLDVGLDSRNIFRPHHSLSESALLAAFHKFLQQVVATRKYRIQQKEVNDFLVVAACDVLDKLVGVEGEALPIQFHTGLGDNDIDLIKANPACLQPLIAAFPNVDFVILHSSYPYTREAGYLAANYANAWLDIGEVFPMLSRPGQESVLRQAFELTPTSKILWSTDGHFYPETFYLANKQFRSAMITVLTEMIDAKDVNVRQAIDITVDIMFWNSNALYKLEEEHKYPQLLSVRSTIVETTGATTLLDEFLHLMPGLKYIWVEFISNTGTIRHRMIPLQAFRRQLLEQNYIGITTALPRLLQNETPARGCVATGQFWLMPDLSSLYSNEAISPNTAVVQSWWMTEDIETGDLTHYEVCPRGVLQKQANSLFNEFAMTMLIGFEIEVMFTKPVMNTQDTTYERFELEKKPHSWSNMTFSQLDHLPMIEQIEQALAQAGIKIDQFHAEAGPGQWEFPLPAAPPVQAVDMLYQARAIIGATARKYGLKATVYPRPSPDAPGNACHAHFSINGHRESIKKYEDHFLAGVLEHLSSVMAFSLPIEESYTRIQSGVWSGSEWITWGTQNREAPIRKCGPGHWELKSSDGMGNMYLTMAALLAAGIDGMDHQKELTIQDTSVDAASLNDEERSKLGITKTLPKTLQLTCSALATNEVLRAALGDTMIDDYLAVKEAEADLLSTMSKEERKTWLIARY